MQNYTDKDKIKTLSIVSLYECETGKQAQRVTCGKSYGNYCPICGSGTHSRRTGALALYVNSNSFYCYSCGAGGSVIDFIIKTRNLDVNNAADYINNNYFNGLANKDNAATVAPTYKHKPLTAQTPASAEPKRNNDGEVNAKLFELVSASRGCGDCIAYLDARGITADLRQRWSVATVAAGDVASIADELRRAFGIERLRAAGVVAGDGDYFFFNRHRILLFNRDKDGGFLNIRARALPSDAQRYEAHTGKELNKYNGTAAAVAPFAIASIYSAPAGATVYLVEGEFDAIAANELGDGTAAAVALGGGGCDAETYSELLQSIAARGLKVCPNFDNDKGGENHYERFKRIAREVSKKTRLTIIKPRTAANYKDFGDVLAAVNTTNGADVANVETYFASAGAYSVANIATAFNWSKLRTRRAFMDAIKAFSFNASFTDNYETINIY